MTTPPKGSSPRAALLLAGGAGTRLWPVSSEARPKQFLPLFEGRSLLRMTWERVREAQVFVSTHERYRELVLETLPELPPDHVLTEPSRRGNAAAITLCCKEIAARLGDPAIACLPSDHFIRDEAEFRRVLDAAFAHAEVSDDLVTIAITPAGPETGYGYLELGEELGGGVIPLRRFVEKPDLARAIEFVESGRYAWNAGMFIWRASVFAAEMRRAAAELAGVTRENYERMTVTSIDFALMEKAARVVAVKGDFGWSDVGNWAAIAAILGRTSGARLVVESGSNVFGFSATGRPIVTVGVDNVIVVESEEGVLVIDPRRAELLSSAVKKL